MKLRRIVALLALGIAVGSIGGCDQERSVDRSAAPSSTDSPAADSTGSAAVESLTAANFDSKIAQGIVLVDFWAPWCGPCRTQGPIVDEVAQQVSGIATVAKLDIDQAAAVAERLGIEGIPTLIVFKDGQPTKQFVGVTEASELVAAIQAAK